MHRTLWIAGLSLVLLAGGRSALAIDPSPLPTPPRATPPATQAVDGPSQIVEQTAREAIAILTDKTLSVEDRDTRLQKLMRQRMDLTTLAHLTVGNAWQNFTPAQRDEFIHQFGDHLLGLYTPLATLYAGQHIELGDDRAEANGDHTVFVIATDRKGPAGSVRTVATISGRMRKTPNGWRAIDVTIEGISIAQTFRTQFQPVIAKQGIDALIQILRQKNAQARSGQ